MATPRVGALGVATTKADLYTIDANGNLERLPVGADSTVLTADSAQALGMKWASPTLGIRASWYFDATLGIFKQIDLGGGPIANPAITIRGTHSVLAFNDTTVQGLPWQGFMPQEYDAASNLTLSIYWVSASAVAGDVVWAAAIERIDTGEVITADAFAALQTAAASTAPAVSGTVATATIAFTNAQADGILPGEPLRVFIQRTASAGGDTMVGDAQLVRATLIEN